MRPTRYDFVGLLLALLIGFAGSAVADPVDAVATPGSGTLTKCRDWLMYESCDTYHHVAVPERVAVGDALDLTFGSSLKTYTFHVMRISRQGDSCTLLSTAHGKGDKLAISRCRAAAQPGAPR